MSQVDVDTALTGSHFAPKRLESSRACEFDPVVSHTVEITIRQSDWANGIAGDGDRQIRNQRTELHSGWQKCIAPVLCLDDDVLWFYFWFDATRIALRGCLEWNYGASRHSRDDPFVWTILCCWKCIFITFVSAAPSRVRTIILYLCFVHAVWQCRLYNLNFIDLNFLLDRKSVV